MDSFVITSGDFLVLGILVISGLVGLSLGLVKAVLFVGSWVGAGLCTLYSYEFVKPYFTEVLGTKLYSEIAAAVSIFIVSLLFLFWLGSTIWRAVRKSSFSSLDRSLGFLGGLLCGVFLICSAYLGSTWVWDKDKMPLTIKNALARPYIQIGTNIIRNLLPGNVELEAKKPMENTQRRIKEAIKTERAMRRLLRDTNDEESDKPSIGQKGYAKPSRRDMDRLFQSKQ